MLETKNSEAFSRSEGKFKQRGRTFSGVCLSVLLVVETLMESSINIRVFRG